MALLITANLIIAQDALVYDIGWFCVVLYPFPSIIFAPITTLMTPPQHVYKSWKVWCCILTCTPVLQTAKHGTSYV